MRSSELMLTILLGCPRGVPQVADRTSCEEQGRDHCVLHLGHRPRGAEAGIPSWLQGRLPHQAREELRRMEVAVLRSTGSIPGILREREYSRLRFFIPTAALVTPVVALAYRVVDRKRCLCLPGMVPVTDRRTRLACHSAEARI